MPGHAISDINALKRQCCACGAQNIALARFCGNCGTSILMSAPPASRRYRKKMVFRGIIIIAAILLAGSGVMSYQLFNSTDSVKISAMPFSDVSLDHPVYRTCRNLLEIKAIGYRKILEFAPHETISAAEWNHVLTTAARHLKLSAPEETFYKHGSVVTVDSLRARLTALNANQATLNDASRMKVFFQLEQAMFNRRVSP